MKYLYATLIISLMMGIFVTKVKAQDMLIGKIKLKDLHEVPYKEWFDLQYGAYTVDKSMLDSIHFNRADKIVLILGTWCGDSKREVPNFFKILNEKGISNRKVQIYSVDRKKQISGIDLSVYNLTRIPTFIFYRNGKEIGRIVESPTESLEKDMARILK